MNVVYFQVFHLWSEGTYEPSGIHVGANAVVYPEGLGPLSMERFVEKIASREFTTQLQSGDRLVLPLFGVLVIAGSENWRIMPPEFIKDLRDAVRFLNNEETSLDRCLAAFRECAITPDATRKAALERAWEAVPAHQRRGLLTMDITDGVIKRLFRGACSQDEIEQMKQDPDLQHVWNPTQDNRLTPYELVWWPDEKVAGSQPKKRNT